MAAPQGYTKLQITLHWTIAALVLFQLAINDDMRLAFGQHLAVSGYSPNVGAVVHIVFGTAILVLALLRLVIRLRRGTPRLDEEVPASLRHLAKLVHVLLYSFIIGVPLTGLIAWFGYAEWSAEIHELGRLLLIPAIGLHVLGALAEHFVYRNDSLKRMFDATAD